MKREAAPIRGSLSLFSTCHNRTVCKLAKVRVGRAEVDTKGSAGGGGIMEEAVIAGKEVCFNPFRDVVADNFKVVE
jgi:hypothetical protein